MDIINKDFCNCTTKRPNKCSICGKKMPYVDSPFGAIPSLSLMETFDEDFKSKFKEKIKELNSFVSSEIPKTFKEKQDQFNDNITKLDEKIQSLHEIVESNINDYEKKNNQMYVDFKANINKTIEENKEKEKSLDFFINQIYERLSDYLTFFSETIKSINSFIQNFKSAKLEYIEFISPQIKDIIKSWETFEKICPQFENGNVGIIQSKEEDTFKLNKQFASKKLLYNRKEQFLNMWNEISLFKSINSPFEK